MIKYFSYLIILNINSVFSFIKLPFKTYKINTSNLTEFFNNYIFTTTIDIGLPPKNNSRILLKQKSYSFYIYDNNYYPNVNYNYKNSSRYKTILDEHFEFISSGCHYGIFSMDTFYIQNQRNDNITFILCIQSYNNEYELFDGQIGLNIEYESLTDTNFVLILKNKKIVPNMIYIIYYTNDDEGYLLVGEYPHNLNFNNILSYEKYSEFKEENLIWINSEITKKDLHWSIFLDKITYSSTDLYQTKKLGKLCIDIKYIISPSQYINLFKQIFNNQCQNIFLDKNLNGFKCDKNINKKLTPEIKFYNNDLNTTFTLDYNDLFIDIDNFSYFLVFSYINITFNDWILGKPFLKKYLFLYNQDSKMIGFYIHKETNTNENGNDNEEDKFNLYLMLIIINILLVIIIIVIGLLFYKYYIKNRKNRANELEDNFEYISKEEKIN